jgi:CheY-like chemotaxis protein
MPKASKTAAKRRRRGKRAAPRSRKAPPSARAIEAMLAELAHEIRTPLTGILSLGELLATSELGARERGWAAAIKETAEHLAMLASLIVDAARSDAAQLVLRRELVRPRMLADALAASLGARAATKGLIHEVTIADDLPEAVIGDGLRLRAALENLVDNAVKFTERGTVRLEVGWEKAPRDRVRLIFSVADSGIGLSAAEIRRLFRPFAQANEGIARRYGGAGLGLAFAKRIAKAMAGDLAVTSTAGGGSCFRLSATVKRVAKAAEAPGTDTAGRTGSARPLHILCAEDNPYGRVVLNTILTELGHRADFVGTGEAAVEAVTRGGYDAVLMDVTLPGCDGLEAARQIRALGGPRIRIIGVSGRSSADEAARARAAGMDDYLPKPLGPGALAKSLAQ